MNLDEYLKQKKREGYLIPSSIDPYRYGLCDLDSLKPNTTIIKNLLGSSELCRITIEDEKQVNSIAALITFQLIKGENILSTHWQLSRKYEHRCVIVADSALMSGFYTAMGNHGITELELYDGNHFYSNTEDWSTVLSKFKPSVCILNLHTRAHNKGEEKNVSSILSTCKRKGVATLLFCSGSKSFSLEFDTEVKISSRGDEQIIETTDAYTGKRIEAFSLLCSDQNYSSKALSDEELDSIYNRTKKQAKPGIDPEFSMEDI